MKFQITARIRTPGDLRDWEQIPTQEITLFTSNQQNIPTALTELLDLNLQNTAECRWSYRGSLQGHYFKPPA